MANRYGVKNAAKSESENIRKKKEKRIRIIHENGGEFNTQNMMRCGTKREETEDGLVEYAEERKTNMKTNESKVLSYDSGSGEPVEWIENGEHHRLTRNEAIEKYGEITDMKIGPRGGHRSVTYGDKMFLCKLA